MVWHIDQAKPCGCWATNDGNMLSHSFKDALHSASISRLNKMSISRCAVILQTVLSGHAVNLEAFDQYAK